MRVRAEGETGVESITVTKRVALGIAAAVAALFVLGVAGGAWASHQFTDVPDNHTHHAGITYVKDVGITAGCTQTTYCPEEFVKRSQVATFFHRASGNAPGIAPSVNAKTLSGHDWTEIDSRFDALEDKLQFVSIVNTNTMRISGANLQVVSGSGSTEAAVNGLGNVIIGYNESSGNQKSGSHNLVVGASNTYTSFGGIVSGFSNHITGRNAAVIGGFGNVASDDGSTVTGGYGNTASGDWASVSGGFQNTASGTSSTIAGGSQNAAILPYASVAGGHSNTAAGESSTVSGGADRDAVGTYDWRAGGLSQDA